MHFFGSQWRIEMMENVSFSTFEQPNEKLKTQLSGGTISVGLYGNTMKGWIVCDHLKIVWTKSWYNKSGLIRLIPYTSKWLNNININHNNQYNNKHMWDNIRCNKQCKQ